MSLTRIFLGGVVGALAMGSMLSVAGYLLGLYMPSSGGGSFISLSKPEILIAIVGAIFGAITGGVSGGVIVGFNLSILNALLFGFLFSIFLSIAVLLYTGGGGSSNDLTYALFALIITEIITAATVSLTILGGKPLE